MLALLQFDSVSLPVLERLLAEGRLPVLADLRARGRWQPLEAPDADIAAAVEKSRDGAAKMLADRLEKTFRAHRRCWCQ